VGKASKEEGKYYVKCTGFMNPSEPGFFDLFEISIIDKDDYLITDTK